MPRTDHSQVAVGREYEHLSYPAGSVGNRGLFKRIGLDLAGTEGDERFGPPSAHPNLAVGWGGEAGGNSCNRPRALPASTVRIAWRLALFGTLFDLAE